MARILAAVLGLAVLAYLGYAAMYGKGRPVGDATPKERLDNVKAAAKNIEAQQERAAEEALKKAEPNE